MVVDDPTETLQKILYMVFAVTISHAVALGDHFRRGIMGDCDPWRTDRELYVTMEIAVYTHCFQGTRRNTRQQLSDMTHVPATKRRGVRVVLWYLSHRPNMHCAPISTPTLETIRTRGSCIQPIRCQCEWDEINS